jgi:hypothetical protein
MKTSLHSIIQEENIIKVILHAKSASKLTSLDQTAIRYFQQWHNGRKRTTGISNIQEYQ